MFFAKELQNDPPVVVLADLRLVYRCVAIRIFLVGVNVGVSQIHMGAAAVDGKILIEERFPTATDPQVAANEIRAAIERMSQRMSDRPLAVVGMSVVGPTDAERSRPVVCASPRLARHSPGKDAEATCPSPGREQRNRRGYLRVTTTTTSECY